MKEVVKGYKVDKGDELPPAEALRTLLAACTGHPTRVGIEQHTGAFGKSEFWLIDYERTALDPRTGNVNPTRTLIVRVASEFGLGVAIELIRTIHQWREEVYLLRAACYACFEMVHPLRAVPQQGHLFHAACASA